MNGARSLSQVTATLALRDDQKLPKFNGTGSAGGGGIGLSYVTSALCVKSTWVFAEANARHKPAIGACSVNACMPKSDSQATFARHWGLWWGNLLWRRVNW